MWAGAGPWRVGGPSSYFFFSFLQPPSLLQVFFLSGCLTFWRSIFEAGISFSFGFFNVRLFGGAGSWLYLDNNCLSLSWFGFQGVGWLVLWRVLGFFSLM